MYQGWKPPNPIGSMMFRALPPLSPARGITLPFLKLVLPRARAERFPQPEVTGSWLDICRYGTNVKSFGRKGKPRAFNLKKMMNHWKSSSSPSPSSSSSSSPSPSSSPSSSSSFFAQGHGLKLSNWLLLGKTIIQPHVIKFMYLAKDCKISPCNCATQTL